MILSQFLINIRFSNNPDPCFNEKNIYNWAICSYQKKKKKKLFKKISKYHYTVSHYWVWRINSCSRCVHPNITTVAQRAKNKSSLKGDEQEIRWKRKRRHSLSDLARVSCTSAAGTELISVVWAWGEIHDWFQQKSQSDKTLQMSSAQPEHQRPLHILHWSHHTCCFQAP